MATNLYTNWIMLKFPPNDVFIFGLHLVPNMRSFGLPIQFYLVTGKTKFSKTLQWNKIFMSTTSLMIFLKVLEKKKFGQISTMVPTTCTQMYVMKMCRLHQAHHLHTNVCYEDVSVASSTNRPQLEPSSKRLCFNIL